MKEEQRLFNKFGRTFPAGTVLFEEGQACAGMYIIQTGKVRLFKKCSAREMTIDILGEGDFFGEMALLIGMNRSATVEVIEDSQILVVSPETFENLLKSNLEIAVKMLKKMAARLRNLDEHLETVLLESQKECQ